MDYQHTVEDSKGGLESLASKIPGYRGYKEKEDRRAADKLLREHLADQLNEQVLLTHTQAEGRRYVQNRAKFMVRCVRMMVEAEDRIRQRVIMRPVQPKDSVKKV